MNFTLAQLIPQPIRFFLGNTYYHYKASSKKQKLLGSLKGDAVDCNICHWKGRCFADDHWHPETVCPNCGSQVRHRLFTATLDGQSNHPDLAEKQLLAGKEVLHFAPERQLRERIRSVSRKYTTADFDRGDCDLKLDMSAMPSVTDSSFDVIIACDVLEHVLDDLAAMRELYRILRPGGIAILSIPQMDPPAVTDQDPSVKTEAEREKRFGQKDHVRMYGDDFAERLSSTGFRIEVITDANFEPESVSRLVLRPPIRSYHILATNERRIYFCRK
jgi:SAM-dependent methyltransferase